MIKYLKYGCIIGILCLITAGCISCNEESAEKETISQDESGETAVEETFIGPEQDERWFDAKTMIPIDFSSWKERNSDVYAWIRIPDTLVDYPILQGGPDDSYYLDHTIDGEAGYPGSIYTERINAKDFTDFNTVIYGHNMKNGTMFKHLHKFKEKEFFDNHEFFEIYTEEETKIYRVYAAVVYSDKHVMHSFDYSSIEGRFDFIESLDTKESWNRFREGMTLDENSRIVTLATCIGGRPNNRWLVIAEEVIR